MVEPNEWGEWAKYFGKMFPTASKEWITRMCTRMVRTLSYDGPTHEMGGIEYFSRLERLRDAINALPPDSNNKLMGA